MSPRRIRQILVLALIGLVCGVGEAVAGKDYKVYVLTKPDIVLEGVRKVAVMDFEGPEELGRQLADRLSGQLVRGNRGIGSISTGIFSQERGRTHLIGGRTDIYEVVARTELPQLIKEIKLSNTGIVDEAAEFGRIKGIDAFVLGSVSFKHSDSKKSSTDEEKSTYSITRTVSLQGTVKVIAVSTGQVLGQKSFRKEKTDTQTSDKGFRDITPKTPAMLVAPLVNDMAEDMANHFAPYYKIRNFPFETTKVKKYAKLSKKAEKLLENRDIDGAYAIYRHIHGEDPYGPKIAFNLGLLHEMVGNYAESQGFYQKAYGINPKEKYKKALDRSGRNLTLKQILDAGGVELQPYVFKEADSGRGLAEKVRLKGSMADRVKVRSKAKKSAKVVAEVPGGMEYTVIEKNGNWYRIELIDGKSGFVSDKAVE